MGILQKLFGSEERVQPVSIDDKNAQQVLAETPGLLIVDIWSVGCAPCKRLEEIIMRLATAYKGRVTVAELCANRARMTVAQLGVRGTPTVLYILDGREVERVVGFRGFQWHEEAIAEHLPAARVD